MSSRDLGPFPTPAWRVLYQNQFRTTIPLPQPSQYDLQDAVGIITGANTGIGLEAARHFLSLGVRLILAVRSQEKGQATVKKLNADFPSTPVEAWILDMDSYPSVQAFAEKCKTLPRLDFVILNAGIHPFKFETSKTTSHEITIQVNYLSTMLLTLLLLPVLKEKRRTGRPPVLSVVSSLNAYTCTLAPQKQLLASFDDPSQPWNAGERYGQSKLLVQIFLNRLVDHIDPGDVIVNMPEPGMVKGTDLARSFEGIQRMVVKMLFSVAGRPVDRAAATYVDAVAGHGQESHGSFLMNNKIAPLAYFIHSDQHASVSEQLWNETMETLSFADINEIVRRLKRA